MAQGAASGLTAGLSGADARLVRRKLLGLLARQAARYTGGDSSSLRVETARALLDSVCYTLELYLRESGNAPDLLLRADAEVLFARGIDVIERLLLRYDRLFAAVCRTAPDVGCRSFSDTLRSIGGLRRRYDYRLFARDLPCAIDYQLCRPVPEALAGVEYVNEYLRRVLLESAFLRHFPAPAVTALLRAWQPAWRDLPLNLFEPAAANALGLALLEKDPLGLDVSDGDRARLIGLLSPLTDTGARAALRAAAERLCAAPGLRSADLLDYLAGAAENLWPRLDAALGAGDLSAVFLPLRQ